MNLLSAWLLLLLSILMGQSLEKIHNLTEPPLFWLVGFITGLLVMWLIQEKGKNK